MVFLSVNFTPAHSFADLHPARGLRNLPFRYSNVKCIEVWGRRESLKSIFFLKSIVICLVGSARGRGILKIVALSRVAFLIHNSCCQVVGCTTFDMFPLAFDKLGSVHEIDNL